MKKVEHYRCRGIVRGINDFRPQPYSMSSNTNSRSPTETLSRIAIINQCKFFLHYGIWRCYNKDIETYPPPYALEFKNAKQNAGKINLLESLVNQLRSIDIGQIEDEGDTIRGYLIHVRDLTNRILKDIENRNA